MGSVELEGVENCIINFIEYTCTLYVEISKSMIWTSFGIERYENQRMESFDWERAERSNIFYPLVWKWERYVPFKDVQIGILEK